MPARRFVADPAVRRVPFTAYTRCGSNARTARSPGRPPTTSTDWLPLRRLVTWARNSQLAPRMRTPSMTTGSPVRRPFQASDRTRWSGAAARRRGVARGPMAQDPTGSSASRRAACSALTTLIRWTKSTTSTTSSTAAAA